MFFNIFLKNSSIELIILMLGMRNCYTVGECIEKMRNLCYNKLNDKLEFVRMIRWSI